MLTLVVVGITPEDTGPRPQDQAVVGPDVTSESQSLMVLWWLET